MLAQFKVRNVLSFKEETILDMTAINAYKEHPDNMIGGAGNDNYLKVAAIYGANASGKSNIALAMMYFQQIVLKSLNNVDNGVDKIIEEYYVPFSFEEEHDSSEFQIVEIVDGFEYRYGFEYDSARIIAEWLYRVNLDTNRTSTIFERTTEDVVFGASVRRECNAYRNQIPQETLVLSFLSKLNLKAEVFKIVNGRINSSFIFASSFDVTSDMLEDLLPGVIDDEHDKLIEFLTAIDTGIKDIRYDDSDKNIRFITSHMGKDGNAYNLNLYCESQGTIKSIALYMFARETVERNGSMIVDELNTGLHPLLLKFIIDLFYDKDSEAQLIYTTHDTTLLDKKFFRRDQIWFVQKDQYGYSKLVALSDYKVRTDASFEKDYLAGVYGGIPLLKEFSLKEDK